MTGTCTRTHREIIEEAASLYWANRGKADHDKTPVPIPSWLRPRNTPLKTHCIHGHTLDNAQPTNRRGTTYRRCRTCLNNYRRARYRRQRGYPPHECRHCGTTFQREPGDTRQHCTNHCRDEHRRERQKAARRTVPKPVRICRCGVEYTPVHGNHRWCTEQCRRQHVGDPTNAQRSRRARQRKHAELDRAADEAWQRWAAAWAA